MKGMAGTTHYMKQNDVLPSAAATLTYLDGTPIDLSPGGTTVKFVMRTSDGTNLVKVNDAAVVVDGIAGTVRYDWAPGDTDLAGSFYAEWEVMLAGTRELTVPDDGYLTVQIIPDLA